MTHSLMGSVHLTSAIVSILLGLGVILFPKGRAPHRLMGLAYAFAMLMTCISALLLYQMTGHFGLFHFFAVLCLIYVLAGIVQAVLRRGDWLPRHLAFMAWSYLGLLAAAATEIAIRLPLLNRLSNNHTFLLGGAIGTGVTLMGWFLMPRWTHRALARFHRAKAPAAP